MAIESPFGILGKRWVRLPLGFVAMSAASLLAFHVGQDAARTLFGSEANAATEAHAPAGPAAKPAGLVQSAAKPKADDPFVVKSILDIKGPIQFGDWYWSEADATPGPLVITVDLQARTMSVFRDGHEIGATAILKGYGAKPTPTGVFPITQKDKDHISNIFDVPMPYMLRLTNDGITIHGSEVRAGYATNGCIGVPNAFAKKLFGQAKLGDKVIITDGKRIGVGDPIIVPQDGSTS